MSKSAPIPRISITERAAKRLHGGHVWVYASDVTGETAVDPGALVHVLGPSGKPLGSAIYSSSSQIKLRLITRQLLGSEEEFLKLVRQRLEQALAYRKSVVRDSDACRLVFSEADRLPGLIVERYNDLATFQILTQAWDRPSRRDTIIGV